MLTKQQVDFLNQMEYTPLWPNWFYSYIDIPNLEPLREELRAFVNNPDKKSFATN